jgi:hypothetical protein
MSRRRICNVILAGIVLMLHWGAAAQNSSNTVKPLPFVSPIFVDKHGAAARQAEHFLRLV